MKTGGPPRAPLSAAKFRQATTPNGFIAFAEIVVRIPRMRALMSSAAAGMRKYIAANIVGARREDLASFLVVNAHCVDPYESPNTRSEVNRRRKARAGVSPALNPLEHNRRHPVVRPSAEHSTVDMCLSAGTKLATVRIRSKMSRCWLSCQTRRFRCCASFPGSPRRRASAQRSSNAPNFWADAANC